jgi:hypothetical protein
VTALAPRLFAVTEGKTSDECYTPKSLFDQLDIEFDLDPASCPKELSAVPARRIYTIEDDGLSQRWEGRVWLNPPYSKASPWVHRFIDHGHGIALLPASRNARWHHRIWAVADGVTMWDGRFIRPNGEADSIPYQVYLWALGADCADAISRVGPVRSIHHSSTQT